MQQDDVQLFASRYLDGADAEDFLRQLVASTWRQPSRSLQGLATNPYMLAAMILVFKTSAKAELPRNRGALMHGLTRALWAREKQRGTPGWQPFDELSARLARLAFAMIRDELGTEAPLEYVLGHLRDDALLRAARSASILEPSGASIRFYHQLIQEYFAGVALIEQYPDDLKYWDDKWRYPLIVWSNFVDDAHRIFSGSTMSDLTYDSAGEFIREGFQVSEEFHRHLISRFVDDVLVYHEFEHPDRYDMQLGGRAAQYLLEMGGVECVPQVVAGLERTLNDKPGIVRQRTLAYVLQRIGSPKALAALRRLGLEMPPAIPVDRPTVRGHAGQPSWLQC